MRNLILISVLILLSCSPQKRLNRLIKRNPELIKRVDTVTIKDTVIFTTERVFKDSIFLLTRNDTVIIREKNLTIRQFIKGDSVYLSGECDTIRDTVYNTIKVPYNVVEVQKTWFRWWYVLVLLLLIIVFARNRK